MTSAAEHTESTARVQVPRHPEQDDECAYCWFEGRTVQTFCYWHPKHRFWHWCPWHQAETPPLRETAMKDRVPPGAQSVQWVGDWHV